jgi:glutamyl-tRNA reductase
METFSLLNRKPGQAFSHSATSGVVWQTCLRQIVFLDPGGPEPRPSPHEALFEDDRAVAFLINVLCGLESPVVGETEVLGQFKNFLAGLSEPKHPLLSPDSPWHQFVLTEVKALRDKHISHLGSKSYGSLIRKELRDIGTVTVLGSGHLAGEVLPWLKDKARVDVWCRSMRKAEPFREILPGLGIHGLEDASAANANQALIVAAPLDDQDLAPLLTGPLEAIIDCRGEAQLFAGGLLKARARRFVSLKDLTDTLSSEALEREGKVQEIRALIQERTRARFDRPRFRPQGWEDLCA